MMPKAMCPQRSSTDTSDCQSSNMENLLVVDVGAGGTRPLTRSTLYQVLGGEIPVHEIFQERVDVVGAGVAVVDVIGVLPDVAGEQGLLVVLHGQVGI